MHIVITCSICKQELQLYPVSYQNDGVDRWSVNPHMCENNSPRIIDVVDDDNTPYKVAVV